MSRHSATSDAPPPRSDSNENVPSEQPWLFSIDNSPALEFNFHDNPTGFDPPHIFLDDASSNPNITPPDIFLQPQEIAQPTRIPLAALPESFLTSQLPQLIAGDIELTQSEQVLLGEWVNPQYLDSIPPPPNISPSITTQNDHAPAFASSVSVVTNRSDDSDRRGKHVPQGTRSARRSSRSTRSHSEYEFKPPFTLINPPVRRYRRGRSSSRISQPRETRGQSVASGSKHLSDLSTPPSTSSAISLNTRLHPNTIIFSSSSILPPLPESTTSCIMANFLEACPGWVSVIDEGTLDTIAYMGEVDLFPTMATIQRHLMKEIDSYQQLEREYTNSNGQIITLPPAVAIPEFFVDFVQAHIDNFWRLAEKEAHSIMFQSSEADLGQLQEDMEATDRRDAAQNILHNQEFLHASKEDVLMYQGLPVRTWITNTFYSEHYTLGNRQEWIQEIPALCFAASQFFFCLVLKQYAATGIRQRQDNISSDNLALRSIYNPSVKSVTFLSSQKEAGPLFDQYRQSLPAEIAHHHPKRRPNVSTSDFFEAIFYPRAGDLS